jgi:hypothetical protein
MRAVPNSDHVLPADSQNHPGPLFKGVSIVAFPPGSSPENAGMHVGDTIIEYDGVENLTTETLSALATMRRPEGIRTRVIFVRNGCKHGLTLPPGPLGISAIDATIHGPFKNPEVDAEIDSSVERLVQFIMSELAQGASKRTMKRTLVQNGWDRKEATLFVDQVANETGAYPNIRAVLEENKNGVKWLALVVVLDIAFHSCLDYDPHDGWASVIENGILGGALLVMLVWAWVVYRKRLIRPEPEKIKNWAALFRPTQGNLQITKSYRGRVELALDLLSSGLRIARLVILFVALLAILLIMCAISWDSLTR